MSKNKRVSYKEVLEKCPEFDGVISRLSWDHQTATSKKTKEYLAKLWSKNIEQNVKNNLWKKHGSVRKDCIDLGRNKAIVGVGAGRSFNKNKHVLKKVNDLDGIKSWKDRDFIIVASNHMFKPLLKMGIIPDFVILVDASDVVMKQLNEDIPESGRNSILLTGLHCSPKVLKEWSNQGREIRFYLPMNVGLEEPFKKLTGKEPKHHLILQGGNVLNTLWSLGFAYFHSTTFMALGNDLSYTLYDNVDKQRDKYYADGDYSSNRPGTGTGRDEAKGMKKWLGFTLTPQLIYTGSKSRYNIKLDLVGTSPTLWVYKTWIEATILQHAKEEKAYHYYNCSEGGILGVMNSSMEFNPKELEDEKRWFMLDEKCSRWHTYMFKDAIDEFLTAKEMMKWGRISPLDVLNAIGSVQEMRV